MKYLYKDMISIDTSAHYVVSPSNYPDRFKCAKVPLSTTVTDTVGYQDKLISAVRLAFRLGPDDEVVLEHVGLWENIADKDGTMPHPFEPGQRLKVETRR